MYVQRDITFEEYARRVAEDPFSTKEQKLKAVEILVALGKKK